MNGEREAALVLEEEGAEAAVAREGVGAHRENVNVAVPDPRNLRFRGEHQKAGEVGFMLEIDPLPFGCRGTCLRHKSSSRKGAGARREVPHRLCTSRAVKIKLLCMSKGPRVVKFSCILTLF